MATYVLVDADGVDKEIKYGPLELEDPNTYVVPEGQKIMLESEALAQGYHYSAGGAALSPEAPAGGSAEDDQGDQGDQNQQ
ncbi:hypothetical protein DMB38_20250 [Streptomyces sp. WAC 06738]|uniref:hypothetical protein n=1 Tax=Streptomyces sp. WAC 06738 TaxID=2203210 RepID=UPI000F70C013|nr:hypothetical protein [Streptomyces sp. WAC 06738]AZM47808.1 hypothetical protein DMB38_20250 [Streptomyces sp. WAC 06738]